MNLIGRKKEIEIINNILKSNKNEFVVLYGRRRVGKTYLIDEVFSRNYSFYATGVAEKKKKDQLKSFHYSLLKYGHNDSSLPKDWFEAFGRLINLLENKKIYREISSNKRIIFIDELPWLDTPKSDFKSAFDYFWNTYGSKQTDLVLIVCGSATSWIIKNLLASRGGFYNRVTRKINIEPFSLEETSLLLEKNGIVYNPQQVIETHMIFGGIPFYLNLLNPRLSLAQNVDSLCFNEFGSLRYELGHLFSSLFTNYQKHFAVIKLLSEKKSGLLRGEIIKKTGLQGEMLSDVLNELEECGFIRRYTNLSTQKSKQLIQLIDPFTLFAINCITGCRAGLARRL